MASGKEETQKQKAGLSLKNACQVVNHSEVPIKVFAISHKDFLQKVRKKLVQDGSFSIVTFRSTKYKEQVKEYNIEEYEGSGKPANQMFQMKGKWMVLAIYMDIDFEDHFTLWRLIEGKKGLQINVRDDHIDETELGDNNDDDEVIEALPPDAVQFLQEFNKRLMSKF